MKSETKKKLDGLSKEQKQDLLNSLTRQVGITDPKPLAGLPPEIQEVEILEVREYLKKHLDD